MYVCTDVRSSSDVLKIVEFVENTLVQLTDNFKYLQFGPYSKIVIYAKNYPRQQNRNIYIVVIFILG